ncbi:glutathione-dependent formaldehyde-activating enzyme [Xylariaceae sp. FL1019]|nr:glutathione-dependent formaldehyde-activating enzyme [Xylariaceae sp. FL1019]
MAEESPKTAGTYEGGCHCGYIKFTVTLSPSLEEYKVMNCNCSACSRFGYLLVYPDAKDVVWHNNSRERCASYRFNTKKKDQMFCPKCGASIGIDFKEAREPHNYGISARTFYNVDLDKLKYKKGDGINQVEPKMDLSGHYWDEEKQEMK